jgi:hypothetical protein
MSLGTIHEAQRGTAAPVLQAQAGPAPGIRLHRLKTPAQIATVQHLSVHAAAGPEFVRLEKKETSAASPSPSSATVS